MPDDLDRRQARQTPDRCVCVALLSQSEQQMDPSSGQACRRGNETAMESRDARGWTKVKGVKE